MLYVRNNWVLIFFALVMGVIIAFGLDPKPVSGSEVLLPVTPIWVRIVIVAATAAAVLLFAKSNPPRPRNGG